MRVLAAVFPQPGHFHAFVGVAQALERAGHEVVFFCPEDLGPRLKRAGLRAPCFSPPGLTREAKPTALRSADLGVRLRRPNWARRFYAQALLGPVAVQVEALRAVAREVKPDVLCTDPLLYAGAIVAEAERIPWAGIATTLASLSPEGFRCVYHDCHAQLSAERDALFRSYGVDARFKCGDAVSPWLNTVFATEGFAPRAQADNAFSHYVGPSSPLGPRGDEPDFPWSRLDPRLPLVYVSFGSQVSPPAEVLASLARAFGPGEAQVAVSLNDWADDPLAASFPDHVIAVRYAPQLRLIERASVIVTHGGLTGVTEALQRGKPMLVIPIAAEQPLQAHLVERAGVGRKMEVEDVTAEGCRSEILELMGSPAVRSKAENVRLSYSQAGGAARICGLIAELARSRRPMAVG